jgi:hypothetical protein
MLKSVFTLTVSACIFALLGACDTLNRMQYQVAGASQTERSRLVEIVTTAAAAAGLTEHAVTSKVPNALAYFQEPIEYFPTASGVRTVNELLVVDLSCFHPGSGEAKAFSAARRTLDDLLSREFGVRVKVVQNNGDRVSMNPVRETPNNRMQRSGEK